jgi:Protein of unknown function (DUF2971)
MKAKRMRIVASTFLRELNDHMQGFRVLCVTTLIDSEKNWLYYAEKHKGIAVKMEPNIAKDSKFQLFRLVNYFEKRPQLYESTFNFIDDSLFGDKKLYIEDKINKIIYTKTREWKHENEYRLVIALREGEKPWNTLSYHPKEITELYLDLEIKDVDALEILDMAWAVNPAIKAFQAQRCLNGKLQFSPISFDTSALS